MNEKLIAFIMCANNDQYIEESLYYIHRLSVPHGYETETFVVRDAPGMAAGYNQAMRASDAKYKIYLHQDVMIVEKNFILNLLSLFQEPDIGIIGMVGSPSLPENAVMWFDDRVGYLYSCSPYGIQNDCFGEIHDKYQSVEAVDGLLIATQYDIPWREDIFHKWDFYDISQCQEFLKQGYQVVVPHMEKPWCIHDCGASNFKNYFEERRKFLDKYKKTEI